LALNLKKTGSDLQKGGKEASRRPLGSAHNKGSGNKKEIKKKSARPNIIKEGRTAPPGRDPDRRYRGLIKKGHYKTINGKI